MTTTPERLVLGRTEEALLSAMKSIATEGIRLGCRSIRRGDEHLLLPEERHAMTRRGPAACRESGAARHVARGLLSDLGRPSIPIGRGRSGEPVWPAGVTGSLSHDGEMAVAAVGLRESAASIGIDVEPAEPLPNDAASLVLADGDEEGTWCPHLAGRVIFAAKEATYKAIFPLEGIILNHDEIAVSLTALRARTRTGRSVRLRMCLAPRIVVLAVASA